MTSRRARAVAMVASLAAASLALGATSASAVIVHLENGKTLSYQPLRGAPKPLAAIRPFDAFFENLDYNGGPVMASNTNYTIYWRPPTGPAYPPDYKAGVNQYLEDLAHDSNGHENVDSIATQYNDSAGKFANYNSHFGEALIDEDPYPASGCKRATICLTDAQIRAELTKFVKAQGLPTDLAHQYFLLTPNGVEDCFEASGFQCSTGVNSPYAVYCAYHGNIPVGEGQLVYSNDPYVTGKPGCDDGNHPNGSTSDGVLQGGLSHEHNESITDPEPNNAWTDVASGEISGYENGDKCGGSNGVALGTASNGAKYNQVINGHFYWYQEEWSNQTNRCLQRFTFSGAEPTATFTGAAGAGTEMTFNATGSTAPGGVFRYDWQFNDGPGLNTPVETTTPTVNHEFPLAGKYLVALTVFASDGTSIGTARTIVTGDEGPTAAFSVQPAAPTAGQPVSFNGLASFDPDGSMTGYEWNFGDGSPPAAGALQSHTYSTPGAYNVTLTVTDSTKQTASIAAFVAVVQAVSAASASLPPAPVPAPAPIPPPNSTFSSVPAIVNATTGTITFTESVGNPGTFSWLIVFQNGRFGVFAASRSKCRRGFVRLKGHCRPSSIVFARGSTLVAGAGAVTFRITPTASGMKALRNALRQKRAMRVSVRLTFQSSRGGSPVSQTSAMTVRLKRRR